LLVLLLASLAVILLPTWLASDPHARIELAHIALSTPGIALRTAPWYEWALLEGIGEARARRIVAYRTELGRPMQVEDLYKVPGMPADWVDRAKKFLIDQ
jgi:competence ComEA-like helix-hairpin-helix protein